MAALLLAAAAAGSLPAQEGESAPKPAPAGLQPPSTTPAAAQGEDSTPYTRNAAGEITFTLPVRADSKMEQVLMALNENQPVTVRPFGKVLEERVTVPRTEMTLEQALAAITQPKGWYYWKLDDGSYGIADKDYFEREVVPRRFVQKVFQPKNLKASELQKAVQDLLTKGAANGSAVADDRTNKLIVNDLPIVMERIERLLREIDVQLITRVFRVRHADVADLAKKIESYKSGPGTIEVDEKTHQIIVTDLLANVKKMELLIDILDVGPEIVIYDVNNIGIDGKDLESLQKIIDTIRTKDLLFEVNEKQGVFILEDVPSVQEKVEQILASFDRPVKQVQIQGEIVSASFERTFNLGIDKFLFSEDLFSAAADGALTGLPGVSTGDLALDNLGFRNLEETFPAFDFTGSTITGSYLNSKVAAIASATFSDTNTKILLQPNLLVKNQEESSIFVGSETPFLTTYFTDTNNNDNNNGFNRSQTQQRLTDGLDFAITPSISNSFLIEMEISIANDKAFQVNSDPNNPLIGRDRQKLDTVLQIPSGQTRVIGGLVNESESKGNTGLPFLVNIPYLGYLFGKKTESTERNNLLLFITPTVVEDSIPRERGKDGRRGRLVSEYEKVPEEFSRMSPEMQRRLEEELENLRGDIEDFNPASILSGDPNEEAETLKLLRDALPEDERKGAMGAFENSNYTPSLGSAGSSGATINSDGGSGAGASQGGAAPSGDGSVRPAPGRRGGNNNNNRRPVPAETKGGEAVKPATPPTETKTETGY